jgi:membrane-bound lytic murein transglycosylase A
MTTPMIETLAPTQFHVAVRDFSALNGWQADDHLAAFQALRQSALVRSDHPPKSRRLSVDKVALTAALSRISAFPAKVSGDQARAFFEAEFEPFEIIPEAGAGFFTGYYEPIVKGSRIKTDRFKTPLYRTPDDLVELDPASIPANIDPSYRFAQNNKGSLAPYFDRAEIEAGALQGCGLEFVFIESPVDAFFIHIQGAARIELAGGDTMRVTYAAKSGHPYTPIGRALIELGELSKGKATMATIRAWLAANPEKAGAIMARNRSFIFFREAPVDNPGCGPIAAAKVPLSAERSLAVDRLLHSFHTPIWVETTLPDGDAFRRLMISQDTGTAIVGPARGDIFFGSGDRAGAIAGEMANAGRFVVLAPRGGPPPGTSVQ